MASLNLNKVVLAGHLAADPEMRQTQSGIPVCSFRVGVSRRYQPKTSEGQSQSVADFITVVAWRQQAEFVSKYFQKGSPIVVEGSLQTRQYQDKNGNNRTAVEVVANQINFVPRTNGQGSASGAAGYAPAAPAAPAAGGYSRPAVQDAAPSYSAGSSEDFAVIDDNEDLPF